MEELQARHRKEQRDLQSRVTQKKKQASKKTRKGVNEECERLEAELKERQEREVRELNGEVVDGEEEDVGEKLEELTLQVDEDAAVNGTEPPPPPPAEAAEEDLPSTTTQPAKKRNRQKDRLARRAAEQTALAAAAAEEASHLPDHKAAERTRMLASMQKHSLREIEIRADGHCLYSAVADQLSHLSIPITPSNEPTIPFRAIRGRAADYIQSHQEDFAPFLEEPLPEYLHKVRNTGEWGGQLELMALAKTYGTDINVLQDHDRVEKIESGSEVAEGEEKKEMWLGYYKHGFGLGEHYNSLRKVP